MYKNQLIAWQDIKNQVICKDLETILFPQQIHSLLMVDTFGAMYGEDEESAEENTLKSTSKQNMGEV